MNPIGTTPVISGAPIPGQTLREREHLQHHHGGVVGEQVISEGYSHRGGVTVRETPPSMERVERLPSGVLIRRITRDRTEELNIISVKIAKIKESLYSARKDADDHEKLRAESEAAIADCMRKLSLAESNERTTEELKRKAMDEELRLEELRAAAHSDAVRHETERAKARAERVMAERTIAHARELMEKHEVGARHALDLQRAYELALTELESRLSRLQHEHEEDIEVIGSPLPFTTKPIDIEVKVEAENVPEIRRADVATTKGGVLRAHIEEQIPPRQHIHVAAEKFASETRHITEEIVETTGPLPHTTAHPEVITKQLPPGTLGKVFHQENLETVYAEPPART